MEQVGELTACQAVPEAMELHRQNTMCINLTAPPYRVIGLVTKESTLPCNVPVSHLIETYLPIYMNDTPRFGYLIEYYCLNRLN